MKKIVSLLLSVVVTLSTACALASGSFDMSEFSSNTSLYSIDVDTDSGVAFIETTSRTADVAFTHKYESSYYYSTIRSDILVINYFSSSRYPVLRTWIEYYADKPLYIYAVSFVFDGTTYTFTDVSSSDRIVTMDHGISESLLIKYGSKNVDFFSTIAAQAVVYTLASISDEFDGTVDAPEMKMILHGTEDLEVDVPTGFWVDYAVLVLGLLNADAVGTIGENDGTPCKIK